MDVHPTAIVAPSAQLGEGVVVGPFCVVGPRVRLGAGCRLHSHVVIDGDTEMGPDCEVWPFASIGAIAQDKKLDPNWAGRLRIGAHNKFREGVTINPGTPKDRGITTVGDHNMLLIGAHIGHDSQVGSHVVMTNGAMLAGHTTVADRAVLGALVGLHQFGRIGTLAMVGAGAMVSKDAPPYAMIHGDRAKIRGVNVIGMRRAGMSQQDVVVVKRTYRELFWRCDVMEKRVERVRSMYPGHPLVIEILSFMGETKRGVLMARGRTDFAYESD